jgi:hypothetical protein
MSATHETSEEWANDLKDLNFGGVTEDLSNMQQEDLGIPRLDEDADAEDEPEVPNKKRKAAHDLEDEDAKKAPKTEAKKAETAAKKTEATSKKAEATSKKTASEATSKKTASEAT